MLQIKGTGFRIDFRHLSRTRVLNTVLNIQERLFLEEMEPTLGRRLVTQRGAWLSYRMEPLEEPGLYLDWMGLDCHGDSWKAKGTYIPQGGGRCDRYSLTLEWIKVGYRVGRT